LRGASETSVIGAPFVSVSVTPLTNDRPSSAKNDRRDTIDRAHIADVRISIGCFNSHRLKTLKRIMPNSIGN
jgi:hypothetical protein